MGVERGAVGYDNNRNYMNLRGARWRDVDRLIDVEEQLMTPCLTEATDQESFNQLWARAREGFDLPDELEDAPTIAESAYALDFGTAAATLALNAAGCPTIISCNGHGRWEPYVGFWLPIAKLALLQEAAAAAGIGLGNSINGAVAAYSATPDGLLRFAKELRRRSSSVSPHSFEQIAAGTGRGSGTGRRSVRAA